jgi:hypothetical protein
MKVVIIKGNEQNTVIEGVSLKVAKEVKTSVVDALVFFAIVRIVVE